MTTFDTPLVLCRSGRIVGSKLVHEETESLSMTLAVLLQRGEHHAARAPPMRGADLIRSPSPPVRSPSPPMPVPEQQQVLACGHIPDPDSGCDSEACWLQTHHTVA